MTRCILIEDLARLINPEAFRTYPTDHYTRAAARQAAREAAERVLGHMAPEIDRLQAELAEAKADAQAMHDMYDGVLLT